MSWYGPRAWFILFPYHLAYDPSLVLLWFLFEEMSCVLPTEDGSLIENVTEISGLQEQSEYASVAEGTDPYTAPEQAEANGTDGEEKPPEEVDHDTE